MDKILYADRYATPIKKDVLLRSKHFLEQNGFKPGLAVIMVGDNPASDVYVKNKIQTAQEVSIASFVYKFPKDATEQVIEKLIYELNMREDVHGIIIQLPLPLSISVQRLIDNIDPAKDVDGLHTVNIGKLVSGAPHFIPCTARGILGLIKLVEPNLSGLNAVVVGRSKIVGLPTAHLLLQNNCTVTLTHSQTNSLEDITQKADILVVAAGYPYLIKSEHVKEGVIIIDVGINRIKSLSDKFVVVGDVDLQSVLSKVRAITPVPKGVGVTTVASLMLNTCEAAENKK